jgi:hypothetical protein
LNVVNTAGCLESQHFLRCVLTFVDGLLTHFAGLVRFKTIFSHLVHPQIWRYRASNLRWRDFIEGQLRKIGVIVCDRFIPN